MAWAPVVGLALGGIAAGVLELFGRMLHPARCWPLCWPSPRWHCCRGDCTWTAWPTWPTGWAAAGLPPAALAIMRQSDIGPFGVVTLVLTLLTQVAALARAEDLGRGYAALLTAGIGSRLAMTWACRGRALGPAGGLGRGGRDRAPGRRRRR